MQSKTAAADIDGRYEGLVTWLSIHFQFLWTLKNQMMNALPYKLT